MTGLLITTASSWLPVSQCFPGHYSGGRIRPLPLVIIKVVFDLLRPIHQRMSTILSKEQFLAPWWLILLQGLLSLFVGVMLLTAPDMTLVLLVRLLGWYWLIKGVFSLTTVFHPDAKSHRSWLLFVSAIGIVAGIAVLEHPLVSALFFPAVLVSFIGCAGLLIGLIELSVAFRGAGWGMGVLGAVSILLGGALLINTSAGIVMLLYLIGAVELCGGLLAVILAFKLKAATAR